MSETSFHGRVAAIRRFNRFYTQRIGVLKEGLLDSPFSLTESRVLYELAHRDRPTATELVKDLGLDAGYLSRILRGFEKRRLLSRTPSKADGRQSLLALTEKGQRAFAPLQARSRDEIGSMLQKLPADDRGRLTEAMHTIERLLEARPEQKTPYLLRPHHPGDMGWVVHRHAVLYAQEYGLDEEFEALVAEIVAKFIRHFDPKKERCWMAEKEGEIVGSAFIVKQSPTIAKLRLLLVEPKARGLGLGARLVDECIQFARRTGYRKITLWTNSVLLSARHIYRAAGFRMIHEERHRRFGQDLIGETWELTL